MTHLRYPGGFTHPFPSPAILSPLIDLLHFSYGSKKWQHNCIQLIEYSAVTAYQEINIEVMSAMKTKPSNTVSRSSQMIRIMKLSYVFLFFCILGGYIIFTPGIPYAETLVLQPGSEGKDAGVGNMFEWNGTNFGDSEWFSGIGLISYFAAFIEFDLSSIPAGSTIDSAIITLWAEYLDGQIYFRPVISAWDEMSITWDDQPSTLSPEISYPISRGDPGGPCYMGCALDFDITSIVQYWIDNSNFGLRVTADTPGVGWLMASSDNLTYPTPKLTVEYGTGGVEQASWGVIKNLYR